MEELALTAESELAAMEKRAVTAESELEVLRADLVQLSYELACDESARARERVDAAAAWAAAALTSGPSLSPARDSGGAVDEVFVATSRGKRWHVRSDCSGLRSSGSTACLTACTLCAKRRD